MARGSNQMLNGGQVIVDYLIREKVPYAFGLCGHGNIGLIDALYERADEIKTISSRHETVSGFMADVYYRVSGQPTATFTSCGPGSVNLPIALANAYLDSVPFLAITGNIPTSQFGRGAFQELYRQYQADFPSTVRAMCKHVFQPTRGEQVPLMVRQAWKTMVTGRPGPVVLDVPFDIFKEDASPEVPDPREWSANISCRCGADPEGVAKAAEMLINAERPAIIVGQGVRYGGAAAELLALAERLNIPVGASASGLGAIDTHHPLSLALVSRGGLYQANAAMRESDVLLALGVRFDDRTSSSWIQGYSFTIPPTRLIHVDIDPDEIGRNYPVALGLMADVRTFLRQLLAEIDARKAPKTTPARQAWLAKIDGWRQEWDAATALGSAPRTRSTTRCPRMPSSSAISAFTTTGSCSSASPPGRTRLLAAWGSGRWGLASPACSAPSSPRPTGPASRSAATAPFSCMPTCSAPRSNTASRRSGWCGTTIPTPRSAGCSVAISTAACWRPISTIPRPASSTTPISPRWRARAGSTAAASTAPAISAMRSRRRSPPANPI
jgi:thiamine pyrophosphate-dependent acetolactate synthase large subunit-like protein